MFDLDEQISWDAISEIKNNENVQKRLVFQTIWKRTAKRTVFERKGYGNGKSALLSSEERLGQRNNARRDAEINIVTMCFWCRWDGFVLGQGRAEFEILLFGNRNYFCFFRIPPGLLWKICLEEIVVKQNQRKHDRSQVREKRKHPKDKITQLDDFRKGNILS